MQPYEPFKVMKPLIGAQGHRALLPIPFIIYPSPGEFRHDLQNLPTSFRIYPPFRTCLLLFVCPSAFAFLLCSPAVRQWAPYGTQSIDIGAGPKKTSTTSILPYGASECPFNNKANIFVFCYFFYNMSRNMRINE